MMSSMYSIFGNKTDLTLSSGYCNLWTCWNYSRKGDLPNCSWQSFCLWGIPAYLANGSCCFIISFYFGVNSIFSNWDWALPVQPTQTQMASCSLSFQQPQGSIKSYKQQDQHIVLCILHPPINSCIHFRDTQTYIIVELLTGYIGLIVQVST